MPKAVYPGTFDPLVFQQTLQTLGLTEGMLRAQLRRETHQDQIAGYDHGPRFAAPMLGQHTYDVLSSELGFTDEQIADAAAAGALG